MCVCVRVCVCVCVCVRARACVCVLGGVPCAYIRMFVSCRTTGAVLRDACCLYVVLFLKLKHFEINLHEHSYSILTHSLRQYLSAPYTAASVNDKDSDVLIISLLG